MPDNRWSLGSARTALIVCLATAALDAQRLAIAAGSRSLGGPISRQALVRTKNDTLYALSVRASGQLCLRRKLPGEARFSRLRLPIADATSGVTTELPTTDCSLAIDAKGTLHVLWARYHYPKFHAQHYRRIDPERQKMSPIVRTSPKRCGRSDAMALAVDDADRVCIAAPSDRHWKSRLLRVLPGATETAPILEELGRIGPVASSQRVALAVDAHGRLHAAFYCNAPGACLRTAILDGHQDGSRGRWTQAQGDVPSMNGTLASSRIRSVFAPQLACDEDGDVHMAYVQRPSPQRAKVYVRTLASEATRWSSPQHIATWSHPVRGHNPNNYFALAVQRSGDDAKLLLAHRRFAAEGPKRLAGIEVLDFTYQDPTEPFISSQPGWQCVRRRRVEDRSTDAKRYQRLHARYALFPESMRLNGTLDLSYGLPEAAGVSRLRAWRLTLKRKAAK